MQVTQVIKSKVEIETFYRTDFWLSWSSQTKQKWHSKITQIIVIIIPRLKKCDFSLHLRENRWHRTKRLKYSHHSLPKNHLKPGKYYEYDSYIGLERLFWSNFQRQAYVWWPNSKPARKRDSRLETISYHFHLPNDVMPYSSTKQPSVWPDSANLPWYLWPVWALDS